MQAVGFILRYNPESPGRGERNRPGRIDHRNDSAAMKTNRNFPLRGIVPIYRGANREQNCVRQLLVMASEGPLA